MLYKYQYIKRHNIHLLNKHLNYFFRKIRHISKKSTFVVSRYFHPDFVTIVNNSPVLKEKFKLFFNSFKVIDIDNKIAFYQLVLKSQSIEQFFENTDINCTDLNNNNIKLLIGNDSLYALTKYLFTTTLKAERWSIDDHYKKIYEHIPSHKACPFCGIGEMHKTYREDYDHLSPKRHYPLMAINLKNLVPMCNSCNTKFKGEIDVFYKNGIRRPFAYPYTTELNIQIQYTGSIIPETDLNNSMGQWLITFIPNSPLNISWFEIFQIEKRYREDYLQPKFESWVNDFLDDLIDYGIIIANVEDLKRELINTATRISQKKFIHTNIIKAPLFDYLANCNNDIFYNSVLKMYLQKTNAHAA